MNTLSIWNPIHEMDELFHNRLASVLGGGNAQSVAWSPVVGAASALLRTNPQAGARCAVEDPAVGGRRLCVAAHFAGRRTAWYAGSL